MRNTLIAIIMVSIAIFCYGTPPPPGFVEVRITVCDNLTKRPIKHASIIAYNKNDTTFRAKPFGKMNDQNVMMLKKDGGDYYLIVSGASLGDAGDDETKAAEIMQQGVYTEERVELPIKNIPEDENIHEVTVYLSRHKNVNLSEVTVTASKVKFYHKGDTLVYDATSFVMAEGSTLDALLDQLPGVELKENGQIYVNGTFMEELLLNGKNLFNGNNELMLENLPAYTVKNVEVYKKQSFQSELLGEDLGDSHNVMDVKLKRQYMMGWLGNVDTGYGTKDRYLAKLFALWFSDNVSLSLYGSSNNLSDVSAPGKSDGSWSSERMGSSVLTRHYGGLSYTADGFEKKWEMNGSVNIERRESDNRTDINSRQYLDGGDQYIYKWQNNESKTTEIKTNHFYRHKIGTGSAFELSPNFSYSHIDEQGDVTSAAFSTEQARLSAEIIKNIYDGNPGAARRMVNRNISELMRRGHNIGGGSTVSYNHVVNAHGNKGLLVIDGTFNFDKNHENRFNRYNIDYTESDKSQFESKYFKNHPNYNRKYAGALRYITSAGPGQIKKPVFSFGYKFERHERLTTSELYRLDEATGFDAENSQIGILPTQSAYLSTIDRNQSHRINENDNSHKFFAFTSYTNFFTNKTLRMIQTSYNLEMEVSDRALSYITAESSQSVNRTRVLPYLRGYTRLSLNFNRDKGNEETAKYWKEGLLILDLNLTPQKVSLLNAVNRLDTSDPLNLRGGNSDIKDSYNAIVSIDFEQSKTGRNRVYHIGYENVINAIGTGIWYNPATGVATWRPFNVNGNWKTDASYFYYFSFGKHDRFDMSTKTSGSYQRSVDLSGETSDENEALVATPGKRQINISSISENLKFNWRIGKNRLTALAEVKFYDYNSHNNDFTGFTSFVYKYGLSGVAKLPAGFDLSTDFTLYTRRGFSDSRLNTTDAVWNARLSKSIMKGAMVLAIDGYDLLHQLTNLTYTINAQARTEIISNVVPSYVLFHVMYKFNHQPAIGNKK